MNDAGPVNARTYKKKNEQPQQQANLFIARQAVVKKSFQLESERNGTNIRLVDRQEDKAQFSFFVVVGAMEFLTVE